MKNPYRKTVLENGLTVVSHHMPGRQSAAVGIWIKAGGRYETRKDKGISHYLEHILFKGSKKYTCRGIKESIEGKGGSLNGFTSEELTCYFAKLPSRYWDTALDILADMVVNPLLSQKEIDRERTVILEEIKMYKDLPQSYVHELLDEMLWPGQPLGMSVLGTEESVKAIDRKALAAYKLRRYAPVNIVASAAGVLDHDRFVERVAGLFTRRSSKAARFAAAKVSQDRPRLRIFEKTTEQTHCALGFHGFKREHPLKYGLALVHMILGANMSSRLFNELREKRGLAYEIGTQIKRFVDTGAFVVHAGIDNNRVEDAVRLILQELERIKYAPVTRGEFRRAKEFYLGQLMLSLEDTLDHMLWIGESIAVRDRLQTLEQVIAELKRVTIADVQQAASQVFTARHMNLALIGPVQSKEKALSNLLHLK